MLCVSLHIRDSSLAVVRLALAGGTACHSPVGVHNGGRVDKVSSQAIHSSHLGNRHLVSNVLYCSLCHFVTSLLSIGIHIGIFG